MSGGGKRRRYLRLTVGADQYDMPEDVAFKAMSELDDSGVKFDAIEVPQPEPQPEPQDKSAVISSAPARAAVSGDEPLVSDERMAELERTGDRYMQMWRDPLEFLAQIGSAGAKYIGGAIGAGSLAAEGATGAGAALGRIGEQALRQGASGAIAAGADAYAQDPEHDALSALVAARSGGLQGAALGGGLQGVGEAAGGVGRWAGSMAESMANRSAVNRVRAAGVTDPQIVQMSRLHGPDYVPELGRRIERAGLHDGGSRWPQPTETYYRRAGELEDRALADMLSAEGELGRMSPGPSVDVADTIASQRAEAQRLRGLADRSANFPQASMRDELAAGLEADTTVPVQIEHPLANEGQRYTTFEAPTGEMPWSRALEQRRNLDANINWGANPGTESAAQGIRKEVAGNLRAGLDQALNDPSVPPELAAQWRQGRDDYALAAAVQEPAMAQMFRDYGRLKFTPARWAGRVAGGAFAGAPGAFAVGEAADLASKGRGASALAGVQGSLSRGFGGVSNELSTAGDAAATGAAFTGMATAQLSRLAGESRGQMTEMAVSKFLDSAPQVLGPYADELRDAAQNGTLSQRLLKLTQSDAEFRTTVLPHIQNLTVHP